MDRTRSVVYLGRERGSACSTRALPSSTVERGHALLIHGIEATSRGGRVRIDLGEEIVELAAAVCPSLVAGDDIPASQLSALREASDEYDTREAALHLLSYRPRSLGELRERLLRKGFDAGRIDRCLEGLSAAGLIDDAAFAAAHARDAVRLRPKGSRRLVAELRRKGVTESVASAAVQQVMLEEAAPDVELARRAAEGWFRRAGADAQLLLCGRGDRAQVERTRRRFWGYMSRRGFGPDAVRAALEDVCR